MKRKARPLDDAERVDVIPRSGEALLDLLDDLLEFTDIEAARIELKDAQADLAAR